MSGAILSFSNRRDRCYPIAQGDHAMAKKKNRQSNQTKQNIWAPVLGALVGIAIVVGIFLYTDRGSATQTTAPATADVPQTTPRPAMREVSAMDIERTPRIDVSETRRLLEAGQAITIDVRDVQSYVAGHIPGALQIPLQYIPGEIPWFPRDKKIVTYCA